MLAVVAVPAAFLAGGLIFNSYRNERHAMERHLSESVRALSLLLDAELRERMAIVQGLSVSTSLIEGDLEAFRARALRMVTRENEWVVLADEQGRVLVDTSRAADGPPVAQSERPGVAEVAAAGRLHVSNLVVSDTEPRHSVWVGQPVTIGAAGRGVLCLVMTPPALTAALLESRPELRGVVAVIDREKTVVARSRNAEQFVGRKATAGVQEASSRATMGVIDSVTLDGHPSIAAFSVSAENGWMLVVAGHKADLLGPAIQMLGLVLAATALVAAIAVALGWWVSRATEAVAQLILADTQAVARGERVAPRRTGIVEADIVSRALADTSQELATRQAALAQARDAALAASRAKDEFLASLSHELRTPLNPVLLLASEGARDPGQSAEVREIFATIEKNVLHEARLIDDLLDVTRIASGKLALQQRPMALDPVVRDALDTLRSRAGEKRLHLHVDLAAGDARVMGDGTRLQQVFTNVIGNAMKFTPEEGSVAVTSRVDRERGEVVVDVSDSGVGLSAAEIGRIFERFAQGDHARQGRQSRFGGLGLGLAISRSLVELHAGRIEVTSAGVGKGATFRVRLPLHAG